MKKPFGFLHRNQQLRIQKSITLFLKQKKTRTALVQRQRTSQNISKNDLKTISRMIFQKFENDDQIQFLNSYLKILTFDEIINFFSVFDFLAIKRKTRFDSTNEAFVFEAKTNSQ